MAFDAIAVHGQHTKSPENGATPVPERRQTVVRPVPPATPAAPAGGALITIVARAWPIRRDGWGAVSSHLAALGHPLPP